MQKEVELPQTEDEFCTALAQAYKQGWKDGLEEVSKLYDIALTALNTAKENT